jgi:phosphate transport system permease protein
VPGNGGLIQAAISRLYPSGESMQVSVIVIVLLALMAVGYHFGRKRALGSVGGGAGIRQLHSLPSYYGTYVVLWGALPALLVLFLWGVLQDGVLIDMVVAGLPEELRNLPESRLGLIINDIQNLASGNITSGEPSPEITAAAERLASLQANSSLAKGVFVLLLATVGSWLAWRSIRRRCARVTASNGSS